MRFPSFPSLHTARLQNFCDSLRGLSHESKSVVGNVFGVPDSPSCALPGDCPRLRARERTSGPLLIWQGAGGVVSHV